MKYRKLSKRDKLYPSVKYELLSYEKTWVGLPSSSNCISHGGLIEIRDGWLYINPGYLWDGPSGPAKDTRDAMLASLYHDALYELMRHGKLPQSVKDLADKLLKDTMVKAIPKSSGWFDRRFRRARDWGFYYAVKLFGNSSSAMITDGNEVITI